MQAFLDGRKDSTFKDKSLLLAFYSAALFAFYGFWLISIIRRVPIAMVVGLAIVVIGTAIGVILGLYYLLRPPRRKTLGIEVEKDGDPGLWGVTDEIAGAIQAVPVSKILVTPFPGIGVYLDGNIFQTIAGKGRRVLEVGLPSLHGLTVDEFKSILAHEYGHFSHKDTQWSSFTYSMGISLLSAYQSVPGPPREGGGGGIVSIIMAINPAYWILHVFVHLYFRITNGFSRIREVMADVMAMELYGGGTFASGLTKVATNDLVFINIVHGQYVPQLVKEKKVITDFSEAMSSVYSQLDKKAMDEVNKAVLGKGREASPYDSHPEIATRLDYARRFESDAPVDERPVSALFDHWADLHETAAKLYNMRLMHFLTVQSKD